MTLTTHGHHIPNSPTDNEMKNVPQAKCGGTDICPQCKTESVYHQSVHGTAAEE